MIEFRSDGRVDWEPGLGVGYHEIRLNGWTTGSEWLRKRMDGLVCDRLERR